MTEYRGFVIERITRNTFTFQRGEKRALDYIGRFPRSIKEAKAVIDSIIFEEQLEMPEADTITRIGGRMGAERRYDLVIVWYAGDRDIYGYPTEEAALEAEDGFRMACGEQIAWSGIRPAYIPGAYNGYI